MRRRFRRAPSPDSAPPRPPTGETATVTVGGDSSAGHTYGGRRAVLATKHAKLGLIAPPIARSVGLEVTSLEVDTDQLGTFTGDIPRSHPPLETAIRKARLGMVAAGSALGLASEGSIGPDPTHPLLISDREIVALVDDELGIVIYATHTGYDIVSASTTAAVDDDLEEFLDRADFPIQQLIVRPNQATVQPIFKGIADREPLAAAIAEAAAASGDGSARVEADRRAHACPSRQVIIATAAEKLALRLAARCPSCAIPGWGPVGIVTGIPCSWCGRPVDLPRAEIDGCVSCRYRTRRDLPDAPESADPGTCADCNP